MKNNDLRAFGTSSVCMALFSIDHTRGVYWMQQNARFATRTVMKSIRWEHAMPVLPIDNTRSLRSFDAPQSGMAA
jgi:hypothetical protein